ncbi:MAG: AAA family ATPase, partial [Candidatus Freyarchaeota archaeon]|nr:AAA family ATPase [Candidatus Jordarchaeia archaeon]
MVKEEIEEEKLYKKTSPGRRRRSEERWKQAAIVELEPLGYPLREVGEEKETTLVVDNPEVFQAYAREQWDGLYIRKGDLLFDRSLFPDFAFKITDMIPSEGQITGKTIFKVIKKAERRAIKLPKVTLADVVGQKRAKEKCLIIKRYLEQPENFGEWAPKAVLFYGPSGTGKTMTAQALANETGAEFFFVKSPELIGTHVGDAASKIGKLFRRARDAAPSVIYLDEIDAIGLDRRFQSVRGDVTEVVNALLAEIDGLELTSGVVCIGATNNMMLLDSALRSRFEEEIEFTLPSVEERRQILEMYAKKIPIRVECDFNRIAMMTEGFSGRDLKEKLLKTAFHRVLIKGGNVID